jgi:hypothetical protein
VDNDWPIALRVITEEEEEAFPKHGHPEMPSKAQADEHRKQLADEMLHGHPAHYTKVPDEEPVDHTPFED